MEFRVDLKKMKTIALEFDGICRGMDDCLSELESVYMKLDSNSLGRYKNRIKAVESSGRKQARSIRQMETSLVDIINCYQRTELKILGKKGEDFSLSSGANQGGLGWAALSGANVTGGIIAAVRDMIKNGASEGEIAKMVAGIAKSTANTDLIKAIAAKDKDGILNALLSLDDLENMKNGISSLPGKVQNYNWGNLKSDLGARAVVFKNEIGGAAWKDAAMKELKSYIGKSESTPGNPVPVNKVEVATKWAGVALTAVIAGVENYGEFKDDGGLKNKRFWTETAVETATGVALGSAATVAAGVVLGAAATALGVTAGAPAIVVGAAAAGIVWGANRLGERFFGDSLTELAADAVSDSIGHLHKLTGNAKEFIGDKLADMGEEEGFLFHVGNAIANNGRAEAAWGESWFQE